MGGLAIRYSLWLLDMRDGQCLSSCEAKEPEFKGSSNA
jgi:hypothetical protein